MFQECLKEVSGKCLGCIKKVLWVFPVRLKRVPSSWGFQGNLKEVRCVREVSMAFQGCFKEVSKKFQESFKIVSRKFQGNLKEFQSEF